MTVMSLGDVVGRLYRAIRLTLPRPLRFALDGTRAGLFGTSYLMRHFDLTVGLVRRRLRPRRLFVGWVLHGDEDDGGSRLHALLPHRYLRRRGINSVILRKPRQHGSGYRPRSEDVERVLRAGFDVVAFQEVHGPDIEAWARALRGVGTRTVYVTGDLHGTDMAAVVDRVVASSAGLTGIAEGYIEKTSVIEASIETPPSLVKDYSRRRARDEIRVVWVGYPENLHLLAPVRKALEDPRLARFRLSTISRGPEATYQWDRRRVWRQLLDCDIGVLPSAPTDWYQAKPNTRMTMFKALGIPVVASPIQSYADTLAHGRSCYFARTVTDWAECLLALADPERRREMGLADRVRILAAYGFDTIGERWLALFEDLCGQGDPRERSHGSVRDH